MHCFNHPEVGACGICKSCQRALCPACLAEVGKGIACLGRCEEDVKGLNQMIEYNLKMIRAVDVDAVDGDPVDVDIEKLTADSYAALKWSKSASSRSDWFVVFLGSVFLAYSAYERNSFLAVLGIAFLAFGVFSLVRSRSAIASRGAS